MSCGYTRTRGELAFLFKNGTQLTVAVSEQRVRGMSASRVYVGSDVEPRTVHRYVIFLVIGSVSAKDGENVYDRISNLTSLWELL